MLKYVSLLGIMATALLWTGCGGEQEGELPSNEEGVESFDAFYQRFLTDSAFQISRITFPLKSEVPMGEKDLSDKGHYIKKEDWVINVPLDKEAQPDVTIKFEDWDGLVIERLEISNFFYVERKYGLNFEKKWELIYYSGMQKKGEGLDKLIEPEIRKQESGAEAEISTE